MPNSTQLALPTVSAQLPTVTWRLQWPSLSGLICPLGPFGLVCPIEQKALRNANNAVEGVAIPLAALALTTVAKLKGGRRDKSSLLSCRAVEISENLVGQVVIQSFLKVKVMLKFELKLIYGQKYSSGINTIYQVYCLYLPF